MSEDMGSRVEGLRELAFAVGQMAYGVHEYSGNGLSEKVYASALERLNIWPKLSITSKYLARQSD